MQLGPAPLSLTGTGGLPALLLAVAPENRVEIKSARGQNLLRLAATGTEVSTGTAELPGNLGLVHPIAGVRVVEQPERAARSARLPAAVDRPAATVTGTDRVAGPQRWAAAPSADGASNALGSGFNWVPIQAIGALGSEASGVPWAAALAALGTGVAALTLVARRRIGAA
jgi:hypothetical protein